MLLHNVRAINLTSFFILLIDICVVSYRYTGSIQSLFMESKY